MDESNIDVHIESDYINNIYEWARKLKNQRTSRDVLVEFVRRFVKVDAYTSLNKTNVNHLYRMYENLCMDKVEPLTLNLFLNYLRELHGNNVRQSMDIAGDYVMKGMVFLEDEFQTYMYKRRDLSTGSELITQYQGLRLEMNGKRTDSFNYTYYEQGLCDFCGIVQPLKFLLVNGMSKQGVCEDCGKELYRSVKLLSDGFRE